MHIPHTTLSTFLVMETRRIWSENQELMKLWSFPLTSFNIAKVCFVSQIVFNILI